MDYATAFQMGHAGAFELASKLTNILPGDLNHVFFANSGSEAVDTALKTRGLGRPTGKNATPCYPMYRSGNCGCGARAELQRNGR